MIDYGLRSNKRERKGTLCTYPTDIQTLFTISYANTNTHGYTVLTTMLSKRDTKSDTLQLDLTRMINTGSVQGNFASYKAYDQLISLGFVNTPISIQVYAAYNDCQTATESLTL